MSDKTEEPTPKKQRKAREEGDSPTSAFASQALAFLVAVALAPGAVVALAGHAAGDLRSAITRVALPSVDVRPTLLVDAGWAVVLLTAPLLLAAGVAGSVAALVQSGGVIATKRLQPKLERLDPLKGLAQLVSTTKLLAIARAALFAVAVAYFAGAALERHAADLARTSGRSWVAGALAGTVASSVATRAAIFGLFLALVDVVITRISWRRRLRMSKDEVRREHKESEGDPQIKAARERAHQEMLASATVANVRHASVVVVNPTHIACAVRYDEAGGDEAPVVVASGSGDLAARIIEAARIHGVPVLRDVPLARALVELEVGSAIPEALYEAVAEILREAWEEAPELDTGAR